MPDYQAFSPHVAKIPVETEKEGQKTHKHFGITWFMSIVGVFTASIAYFSYTHKDNVFHMWQSPTSKKAAPERLSLERVSYSLVPDKAASKITIVGEIVNKMDSSLNVSPLRIKVFSKRTEKLLLAWNYSPSVSSILPNEHSFFEIEQPLRLDPSEDIQVEVSFISR
jgi:hypothetical protein